MARSDGILEIRVHGVHGTAPSSMLGVPAGEVGQVAGNGTTGVFRARNGRPPGPYDDPRVAVEAYTWGALTSGVSGVLGWLRRAAWLLLLPFALVNIAYWARPHVGGREPASPDGDDPGPDPRRNPGVGWEARWGAWVVRFAGLLLTMLMMLSASTVAIDLAAWQCYRGGTPTCPAIPGMLDFLARDPFDEAPRRIAIAALVPLAVLAVLWLLSRHSLARWEDVEDPAEDRKWSPREPLLRHPRMWTGRRRARRLQLLHVAFGMSVVAAYTGIPVLDAGVRALADGRTAELASPWAMWPYLLLALVDLTVVATAVVVVAMACATGPEDVDHRYRPAMQADLTRPRLLLRAVAVLLVAHLVLLLLPHYPVFDESSSLPGDNVWFVAALVALLALHLVLLLVGRAGRVYVVGIGLVTVVLFALASTFLVEWLEWPAALPYVAIVLLTAGGGVLVWWHRRNLQPQMAWSGAGPTVFLAAGVWVALLFTSSLVTYTADYLNGPDHTVGDLGTSYRAERVGVPVTPQMARDAETPQMADYAQPSQEADATQPTETAQQYFASGNVVVQDAVVDVTPDGSVYVRSGQVLVESFRVAGQGGGAPEGLAVSLGTTVVRNAEINTDDESVALRDTCARPITETALEEKPPRNCTVELNSFVAAGTVGSAKAGSRITVPPENAVLVKVADPPQTPIVIPQVLVWLPLGQVLWLLAFAAVAGWCWARLRRYVLDDIEVAVLLDPRIPKADRRSCVSARLTAAYVHRAERLLDVMGPITFFLTVGVVVAASSGRSPWDIWEGLRPFATVALWVSLGSALALVLLASKMRKSDSARKTVGILWDLTTFWPRAAHPLAPPCYAERVVPELLIRVDWALNRRPGESNHVILSGHSQGSTLVAATAIRLRGKDLGRVRLITYGSQLRAWYGRMFPAVFGPEALGYVPTEGALRFDEPEVVLVGPAGAGGGGATTAGAEDAAAPGRPAYSLWERMGGADGGRWVSLYRRSDPLGFLVLGVADDEVERYVPEVPPESAGDPGPTVMTHSGYQHSDEYHRAARDWVDEVTLRGENSAIKDVPFFPAP